MSEKVKDLYVIDLTATAVSPLYTGEVKSRSGYSMNGKDNVLRTRKTGDGHAAVSIYGVLRRYAQLAYKSEGACDIGYNSKGCGKCLICDLFGYLGKKGRISFEYLKSKQPFKRVVKETAHNVLDTNTGEVKSFLKVEEIQEGTELLGKIIIRNPTKRDIDIILSALKMAEEHGIGGWTKRDLGRVKFDVKARQIDWMYYKQQGKSQAKRLLEGK